MVLLLLAIGTTEAQVQEGSYLWTLNVGYASVRNPLSGNDLNGMSFNTTLEKTLSTSNWALGMNIAFYEASDQYSIQGVTIDQGFSNTFVFLTGKYLIRSMGQWVPYIGLGVGIQFAKRHTVVNGVFTVNGDQVISGNTSENSFAFATPVGVNFFASEAVFIGVNMTGLWMNESYFRDDFMMVWNLGLGFQID
jgi:outer membrane protein W